MICFGLSFTGLHFTTTDNQVSQRSVDYLVKLIDFYGDIGGKTIHNNPDETEPSHEVVRKYFDHIHHGHFQNMDGTLVTSDAIPLEYIQVFGVLKEIKKR